MGYGRPIIVILAIIAISLGAGHYNGNINLQEIVKSNTGQSDACPVNDELADFIESSSEIEGAQKELVWGDYSESEGLNYELAQLGNWTVIGHGIARDGSFGYKRGYHLPISCHQGQKEGENINHRYCKVSDSFTGRYLELKKEVVEEGVIQEKKNYYVRNVTFNNSDQVVDIECSKNIG
jgi:hypothetical protein